MTVTAIRKAAATPIVLESTEEDRKLIATHITHDVNTANKYYTQMASYDNSVKAFERLNKRPQSELV